MVYGTFHDYEDDGMKDSLLRRIQWVSPDEKDEIDEEVRRLNRFTCACVGIAIVVIVLIIIL